VVDLPPESVGELEQRFERLERELSPECDDTCYGWIIRRDGTPAGLLQATCNNGRQAFIGYEVFAPFRRQGVAKAAVSAVLGFLGRATATQQVIAYVDTRNEASINLLLSLGFSRRRLIKGADWFKGSVSDEFEFEPHDAVDAGEPAEEEMAEATAKVFQNAVRDRWLKEVAGWE
jgi:RimJ/RimL family protein N-acetyltransferase